jgi:hypothetical protein
LGDERVADDLIPSLPFTDITAAAGLRFHHFSGATGKLYMPESMGSGCAIWDYDNDGWQDLLLLNGAAFPGEATPNPPPTMALYHNQGDGTFRDVTRGSGLDVPLYGVGVALGDFDGDGRTDVFIAALGPNRLFRNLGEGRFKDVTAAANVAGDANRWSTSAGFFDYDNDGWLDLFVCNYVDWSVELDQTLDHRMQGVPNYVQPSQFGGAHCYLYRNLGNGTFDDVSASTGIQVKSHVNGEPLAKALGVVIADLDEDGWQDLVVANDGLPAFLFHNTGRGSFEEIGDAAGIGFNYEGNRVDGMGIDLGHLYDDNRLTIGIANTDGKSTAMFTSQVSPLLYADTVLSTGIASATQPYTGWGLFFFDCDLDGRLDMFQCTGSVHSEAVSNVTGVGYLEPSLLFWNTGPGKPVRLAPLPDARRSPALDVPLMGRGAAYGDLDNDGDLDILISQIDRPAVLLRNDQSSGNHSLRLKLHGVGGNREALGARVEAELGPLTIRRRVQPTRSYLSQVELPVTVGLGRRQKVDRLRIIWPNGDVQTLENVPIDQTVEVTQAADGK